MMPIHSTPLLIPMRMLSEAQASLNHGQSLATLAERGGLSLAEVVALIEGRKWKPMTAAECLRVLGDRTAK